MGSTTESEMAQSEAVDNSPPVIALHVGAWERDLVTATRPRRVQRVAVRRPLLTATMPINELSDPSAAVEAAQKLQAALENASLHIVKSQAEFDEHTASGAESSLDLPITHSEGSRLADPRLVSLDLAAQLVRYEALLTNRVPCAHQVTLGVLPQTQSILPRTEDEGPVC